MFCLCAFWAGKQRSCRSDGPVLLLFVLCHRWIVRWLLCQLASHNRGVPLSDKSAPVLEIALATELCHDVCSIYCLVPYSSLDLGIHCSCEPGVRDFRLARDAQISPCEVCGWDCRNGNCSRP